VKTTSCTIVLLEKLTVANIVKKFPAFYGNIKFITLITRPRYLTYPNTDKSTVHPDTQFFKDILIISPIYFRESQTVRHFHVFRLKCTYEYISISLCMLHAPSSLSPITLIVTKLLIILFSPSCYLLPLRYKYSPQQPVVINSAYKNTVFFDETPCRPV
jgi:hypothetical protein